MFRGGRWRGKSRHVTRFLVLRTVALRDLRLSALLRIVAAAVRATEISEKVYESCCFGSRIWVMLRTLAFVEHVLPNRSDFLLLRKLSPSEWYLRLRYLAVFAATSSPLVHLVAGWVEEDEGAVNRELVQSLHLVVLVEAGQLLK